MRTIASQDLDAMNAWIDVHGTAEQRKVLMGSLPSLPTGDAWFWSPGWPDEEGIFKRVHVGPISTFDSGATPKPGEKRIEPKHLAEVDLEALRRQMAETVERTHATDPKKLQARVSQLKEAVSHAYQFAGVHGAGAEILDNYSAAIQGNPAPHKYRAVSPPAKGATAPAKEIPAERLKTEFNKGALAERRKIAVEMNPLLAEAGKRLNKILPIAITVKTADSIYEKVLGEDALAAISAAAEMLAKSAPLPEMAMAAAATASLQRSVPLPQRTPSVRTPAQGDPNTALGIPERRILTVLAQYPQGAELDRLAILAGYTVNGHFSNKLGALRTKELITGARVSPIQITPEGLRELGGFEALPTGAELQSWWLNRLSGPEQRIMTVLFEQYPKEISLDELAQKAGYTVNGHFSNKVGSLRTKGLMTQAREPIRAAKDFFE
jgi:hypothetical protein